MTITDAPCVFVFFAGDVCGKPASHCSHTPIQDLMLFGQHRFVPDLKQTLDELQEQEAAYQSQVMPTDEEENQ